MKRFLLACALLSNPAMAEPDLIGGKPVNPSLYPASVYTQQGNSRCTGTMIGPQALIVAAHCVAETKEMSFHAGGSLYEATCESAPGYPKNKTADWSLCHVHEEVANVAFEVLNRNEKIVKVGDELLLTGYGCVKEGGGGGNDGLYRIGSAKVTSVPYASIYDYVTAGAVALCFGDSGGPVFKVEGNGSRSIVALNSRGNIKDTSYLVSVANKEFEAFLLQWSKANSAKVCGYDQVSGCRAAKKKL